MKRADYCVIGLGRFGSKVASKLKELGYKVLIIDKDKEKINLEAKRFDFAISLDATDIMSLSDVAINKFDTVILSVSSLEESIIIATNLRELKVKNIIARAKNEVHKRVLKTFGVKEAVIPEEIVGENIAMRVVHSINSEIISIDDDISLVRVYATSKDVINKRIVDIDIRNKTNANIISITRDYKNIYSIDKDTIISKNDLVTAACNNVDISRFLKLMSSDN
ncbi:potassium channel family protein [Mycoplasma bradburyae]|uniref:TrkA family potassium uptake protein n=1 Tax=Mycoplasma bradburyae TaxID=2963128 RepID=A0AAW6HPW5_9MOLU|nr:TrkA family potassium uptake protein [Mycoplasma bradburyae]MDC4163379.1 TrkA family potassium uptake protein [Mycoplasma bradburyae]MDC4181993.1 TrkA family potassium uptake protein [Mycoplasma bradburyae]MDC4182696.1 TrkA family potassium uptake protein [Mycoplasma bradburyae]MDC4183369.1 TrkA family potassium uptake protein [Mycoplasma bradburyae]MDC4184176.1 TrkA family potassium uptake protein [Mycoplasma bradburyae]